MRFQRILAIVLIVLGLSIGTITTANARTSTAPGERTIVTFDHQSSVRLNEFAKITDRAEARYACIKFIMSLPPPISTEDDIAAAVYCNVLIPDLLPYLPLSEELKPDECLSLDTRDPFNPAYPYSFRMDACPAN